jgi:hypothetical protein
MGELAGQGEQHADGVLPGRDCIRPRRVQDQHTRAGCRVEIDIVDADPGARDHA